MSLISRFEFLDKQDQESIVDREVLCRRAVGRYMCVRVSGLGGGPERQTADTCILHVCVTTRVTTDRQTLIIKTRCVMHTPQIHITGHLTFNYLFKYLETGLSPPPPCCCSIQMFGSHNRESLSSLAMAFEALKS